MNTFAERLVYAIEQSGLTKKEIDATLNLNKNALTQYKKGRIPDTDKLLGLSQLLNVSMNWLLTGEEIPARPSYSVSDREILNLYNQLSPSNRQRILERIETLLEVIKEETPVYKAIPLVGRCAAGIPIEALPDYETVETTKLSADFALTIEGRSMEPTIEDGSIVFVRQTSQLEDGEIGIFQINTTSFSTDEEVTCKIYKRISQSRLQLISINPEYEPIDIDLTKHRCQILGEVIL